MKAGILRTAYQRRNGETIKAGTPVGIVSESVTMFEIHANEWPIEDSCWVSKSAVYTDDTCVGFVCERGFLCPECYGVYLGREGMKVYVANLRPYSQHCHSCKRLIMCGLKSIDLYEIP